MKKLYNLLAILLGYGLIIGGFVVLNHDTLATKVLTLDIVVACVLFTQVVQWIVFPMIRLDRTHHREVGMMGIHYAVVALYALLSIGIMIYGAIAAWSFSVQLIAQLGALLLLLVGRASTLHAGEKVVAVGNREARTEEGKQTLIAAMDGLIDFTSGMETLPQPLPDRLAKMREELRYVTPSIAPEARTLDRQFCETTEDLKVLMRQAPINESALMKKTDQLQNLLLKRKQF